ncbi:MAG: malate synthase A [Alphaproteobacteria bacterium]|nr:malate synthase A [Alphaproteobacteria bacterium]MCD8520044.1 malate synthase A [Alphaproteobacteria bacterium]MCD8569962.1 malate synthase A [Alphaproteobacteria bacterium]
MPQTAVSSTSPKVTIRGTENPLTAAILTPEALAFLAALHTNFNARRLELLKARTARQKEFDAGKLPDFLPETKSVREGDWKVSPPPADLQDRRVEITGPVDAKMIINALNSGAKCFMADFEDASSPTWANMIEGQKNVQSALRRTLTCTVGGKAYALDPDESKLAKLLVRPRGLHLPEKHLECEGEALSGSFTDFGLFIFHNLDEFKTRAKGLYFYIPKLESHLEARLWNDVFTFAEDALSLPRGTIRCTVLIETITAAFEMDEILYELRDHSVGLNAGRWDYIFSAIKKFRKHPGMVLPDRGFVNMTVPFMKAYAELLVKTCHKRGTFAMGGMAAFIPSRRDPAINEKAFAAVTADKKRESEAGFDGTWVAHPDLIPLAQEQFDKVLGDQPNQISKQRPDVSATAADLLNLSATPGQVTLEGARLNVNVAIQYITYWLHGTGAAAIHNLMEDAATAEISRAQLWQWRVNGVKLSNGEIFTADIYKQLADEELNTLRNEYNPQTVNFDKLEQAKAILDDLVLSDDFEEFLTLPAYQTL